MGIAHAISTHHRNIAKGEILGRFQQIHEMLIGSRQEIQQTIALQFARQAIGAN